MNELIVSNVPLVHLFPQQFILSYIYSHIDIFSQLSTNFLLCIGDNQLFGVRNRRYGRTVLGLYVYRPSKSLDMRPDEFMVERRGSGGGGGV